MVCKDCLHLDVCTAVHIGGEFKENAEKCKNFKNKADLVEMTCEKKENLCLWIIQRFYIEAVQEHRRECGLDPVWWPSEKNLNEYYELIKSDIDCIFSEKGECE